MLKRVPPPIVYSARDPTVNTQHVFLAVDPSGGGASAFSIASIVQGPSGFMHVRSHLHSLMVQICPDRLPRPQLTQCAD